MSNKKSKISKKSFILPLIIVLIAVSVFALKHTFRKPDLNVANIKAEFSMLSDELYSAYEINEISANDLYLGKVIDVTGKVTQVEKLPNEGIAVVFGTGMPFGGVRCVFEVIDEDDFAKINLGSIHTIKGRCSGMLTEVVMEKSTFIK
jgi:hypothetical protein